MEYTKIRIIVNSFQINECIRIIQSMIDYLEFDKYILNLSYQNMDMDSRYEIIINVDSDIDYDTFITFILEKYRQLNISFDVEVLGNISLNRYKKEKEMYSKPIKVGNKTFVKVLTQRNKHFGILDKYDSTDGIMLTIDPSGSFGTGCHPTTKMCIKAIENHIDVNDDVLDVGCGSGILSIVSVLLGAKSAIGVDINSKTVKCAKNNAILNNVTDRFNIVEGSLVDKIKGKYDLVVANILTDPLKQLLVNIKDYMKPTSKLILSGIGDFREYEIVEMIKNDFDIIQYSYVL
jgi:ribosomal protein L11 methyltransferase